MVGHRSTVQTPERELLLRAGPGRRPYQLLHVNGCHSGSAKQRQALGSAALLEREDSSKHAPVSLPVPSRRTNRRSVTGALARLHALSPAASSAARRRSPERIDCPLRWGIWAIGIGISGRRSEACKALFSLIFFFAK